MTRLTRLDREEAIAVNQALVLLLNRRVDNERQARPYNHLRNGLLNPPISGTKKEELLTQLTSSFAVSTEDFSKKTYFDLYWPLIENYFESTFKLAEACCEIGLPAKAMVEGFANYSSWQEIAGLECHFLPGNNEDKMFLKNLEDCSLY
jgi:hypothetical protein